MTDSIQIPIGEQIRAAMIVNRVLRPQGERPTASALPLDEDAVRSVAREILGCYGRQQARALALEPGTDSRMSAALFALLGGAP